MTSDEYYTPPKYPTRGVTPITFGDLRDALRKVREAAHDGWLHTYDDSIKCARLQAKFEICDDLARELGL